MSDAERMIQILNEHGDDPAQIAFDAVDLEAKIKRLQAQLDSERKLTVAYADHCDVLKAENEALKAEVGLWREIANIRKRYCKRYAAQLDAVRALPDKWMAEAYRAVPRGLNRKYLNGDVYAGGLRDCSEELEARLKEAGDG